MTLTRLLGLGVVATASIAWAQPAAAEDIPVGGPSTITIAGHGYGHGHGLSQYGAQGAANQGLSYKQIVSFYYPGTNWSAARGAVKVLISADTSKDVVVDARDGLRLNRLTSGRSFSLEHVRRAATRWRITPKRGGRSEVSYRLPGRSVKWHKWTSFPGDAEFTADNSPLRLYLPGHTTADYRGALRSIEKDTVNVLPLDRYLQGVVPREVPAEWPAQAVRAQAVAARTYAAYERAHPIADHYQICDTDACQVYGGYADEHPESNAAVQKTRGKILTYGGEPAFTQFSSSNGGWTSAGSQPYLVAQQDPYEAASANPNANWTVTITDQNIEKAWPAVGDLSKISFTRDGHGDFGGRVLKVVLTGTKNGAPSTVNVSGDDFRFLLGPLRSTYLNLNVAPAKQLPRPTS